MNVDPIVRSILGHAGHYELETIQAVRRHAVAARHAALAGDLRLGRDLRAGREGGAALLRGLHRLHWLREAFDTVCYGFFPLRTMETELA